MEDLQARICALYRVPPEDFIVARDELANELRAEGAVADAATVKRHKRPSVAAWALDQLAGRDPAGIEKLLQGGAALRATQQGTDSGGAPFRAAVASRRAIVGRLTKEAMIVLREAGRSPEAHLAEIGATLEAASADRDVAEHMRTGTLERTVSGAVGFGELEPERILDMSEERRPSEDVEQGEGRRRPAGARREELARLIRELEAAERISRRADKDLERARARVADAEERLRAERHTRKSAETVAREAELDVRRAAKAVKLAE